ncbi:hypothetical protein VTP01DRAFT_10548 [Rhizomucor pusillus]|uniref:uncharacterized protein n=1 Tax=Rhizomucor pusillus TaxID=4840 RepID=UPI00374393BB
MKDLEPLDFTVELGRFYEKARTSGTVSVTMKRMTESRIKKAAKVKKMTPKGGEAVLSSDKKNDEQLHYPCLVRAQFKNEKISTIVADKDFEKFHEAYTTVIKAHRWTL